MTAFDKLCLHCFITFHYELLTVCAVGGRYGLNRGFTVMWWLTILVIVITSHLNLAGEFVNMCCRVGLGRSPQLKSDSEELSFSNRSLRLSCLGCRTVYCCKWDLGFWKISPAAFPHRSVKWLMWEHPSTIRGAFLGLLYVFERWIHLYSGNSKFVRWWKIEWLFCVRTKGPCRMLGSHSRWWKLKVPFYFLVEARMLLLSFSALQPTPWLPHLLQSRDFDSSTSKSKNFS